MLKCVLSSFPTPGLQEHTPPPVNCRQWLPPCHSFPTRDFRHWIYIATASDQTDVHLLSLFPPASGQPPNIFCGFLYVQAIFFYLQCWKGVARSGISEHTTPQGTSCSGEGMAGRNVLHGIQGDVSQVLNRRPQFSLPETATHLRHVAAPLALSWAAWFRPQTQPKGNSGHLHRWTSIYGHEATGCDGWHADIYISMPKLPQQHVTSIHKYNYTRIYWEKVAEWLEHASTASLGEDLKELFGAIKTDA